MWMNDLSLVLGEEAAIEDPRFFYFLHFKKQLWETRI